MLQNLSLTFHYSSIATGPREGSSYSQRVHDGVWTYCFLTVLVQEELVESQPAGLLADEAVHVLGAVVVHGNGVFQRFNARLQTKGNLGVADGVPDNDRGFTLAEEDSQKGDVLTSRLEETDG